VLHQNLFSIVAGVAFGPFASISSDEMQSAISYQPRFAKERSVCLVDDTLCFRFRFPQMFSKTKKPKITEI
jgi:hypothetical protein